MGDGGMWQVIAQAMRNIANVGKNAQVNGSTANGSVGLINPDFKKSDAKSENKNNENSVLQTTENTTELEKANNIIKKIGSTLNKAGTTAKVDGSVASFNSISPTVVSDERLKDIFGEETPIDCFAKIHSYEFKYTPEAQEMMQGKNHVDDKEHLGVMAQELLMNPATSACVIKDTDGFLKVDTAQLTMANTATIAELSRKVQKLEQTLGER